MFVLATILRILLTKNALNAKTCAKNVMKELTQTVQNVNRLSILMVIQILVIQHV